MEDRFTDGVKNAWKFAASEAAKLGSDYIGTEHLLLGIAHEKDSAGGKILNSWASLWKQWNSCFPSTVRAGLFSAPVKCMQHPVPRGCWRWQWKKLMNWVIPM